MITIQRVNRPNRTIATATVDLVVKGELARDVLDAGLTALGETRASVFGCGVRDDEGWSCDEQTANLTGTFTVWAWRD